ncbi:Uncharacterized protein QTN25_007966 [Entamoeba marina]
MSSSSNTSSAITISFSIHYNTEFGQELYVNLDDYTCRKLTWKPGHIWIGSVTVVRPRTMKWWYSVHHNGQVERVEIMNIQREYLMDNLHKYYHVFDRWGNVNSSVSPLTIANSEQVQKVSQSDITKLRSSVSYVPKVSPFITSVLVHRPRRIKIGYE